MKYYNCSKVFPEKGKKEKKMPNLGKEIPSRNLTRR